jgi:UDP-N-acetyl-D-glucosamine dehydrogenase
MSTAQDSTLAVIGLGYVGLPLAMAFAEAGTKVIGIDLDARKIESLRQGKSYIADVSSDTIAGVTAADAFCAVGDYDALRDADAIFICVPTPFDAMRSPDLSFIRAASQGIAPRLRAGQLVVLQSTTYPGTTQDIVLPILEEESGLHAGVDFNLAFSPERIDPGPAYRQWTVKNTPKVVGGLTPGCAERARALLSRLGAPVQVVSSPRAAEMTKLLENIFRSVNIALVNELALLSDRMGIDIWEVIEAAKTKPFGFMPFYPGAGAGGHCIPVDPYYLSWKAREYDFYTKFIELAAEVNQAMPFHVVNRVADALSRRGRALHGARILVLGVAFKRDVDDARNSPAQRVIELLMARGAEVTYHDPHVPMFHVGENVFLRQDNVLTSTALAADVLAAQDCVVIITGHHAVDYAWVVQNARLVVDTCNATASVADGYDKVVRLGAPSRATPQSDTIVTR